MAKWADYGISAVRYNVARTHIDMLQLRADNGETLGGAENHARSAVIEAIKKGTTFVTILLGTDGKWWKGQSVYIIKVNGVEYIKTVDNGRASDNLESLPEF